MDRFEIRRQIFHIALGLVIVFLFYYEILEPITLGLILVTGILLSVILTRWKVPFISWFIKTFDRTDAKFPGEGAVFYVMGCLIVLSIFDKNIAMASIMVLALGDSVATLVGKHFGKKVMRKDKTLEGTLAGSIAATLGAMFFVTFSAAVVSSFVTMLVEGFEIKLWGKGVDDNLYIPIISALIMYLII